MEHGGVVRILSRAAAWIALGALAGGALAWVLMTTVGPQYNATAVVVVVSNPYNVATSPDDRVMNTEAAIANSDSVRSEVEKRMGADSTYTAAATSGSNTMRFSASAGSAPRARAVVLSAARAYGGSRLATVKSGLERKLDAAKLTQLRAADQLRTATAAAAAPATLARYQSAVVQARENVTALKERVDSTQQVSFPTQVSVVSEFGLVRKAVRVGFGALLGALVMVLAFVLRERWNPRVRSVSDLPDVGDPRSGLIYARVPSPPRRRSELSEVQHFARGVGAAGSVYVCGPTSPRVLKVVASGIADDLEVSGRAADLVAVPDRSSGVDGVREAIGAAAAQSQTPIFYGDAPSLERSLRTCLTPDDTVIVVAKRDQSATSEVAQRTTVLRASSARVAVAYVRS